MICAMTAVKQPSPPTFTNVHKDIERRIEQLGQVEKAADGFLVYRGYDAARDQVISQYFAAKAYEPLVRYFRTWNWEVGDNDFLRRLTAALKRDREWAHLKRLWDGVIGKRERHYRQVIKVRAQDPKAITSERADHVRDLTISAVKQLRDLAQALDQLEDFRSLDHKLKRLQQR